MTKAKLSELRPDLAAEWDAPKNLPYTLDNIAGKTKDSFSWVCLKGHQYLARVQHRAHANSGCPYCSGNKVMAGYNDLATLNPSLAAEWHPTLNAGLLASMVSANAHKKAWWLCTQGHDYESDIANRNFLGRGCPYCSNQKILIGFNDLATTHPKHAAEWDDELNQGITPQDVFAGTGKKFWWKCQNHPHSYLMTGDSKTHASRSPACSVCTSKQILVGFNDLATTRPLLASQWDYVKNGELTPQQFTAGSNDYAWWKCSKGHSWKAVIGSRNKNGCPKCAKHFSQIELRFFTELSKHLDDSIQGSRIPVQWCHTVTSSVDILGVYKGQKVIVEYDGEVWHKEKPDKDERKTQALLDAGYKVIRIRENNLAFLDIANDNFFQVKHDFRTGKIPETVSGIINWLNK